MIERQYQRQRIITKGLGLQVAGVYGVGNDEYYDPMYAYQREHKASRIEFAGSQVEVVAYLRERKARASST